MAVKKKATKLRVSHNQQRTQERRMTSMELGFARDYVSGLPLDECYSRNYKVTPYMVDSKSRQSRAAHRILARPVVQGYIDKVRDTQLLETSIDVAWVLKESERLYNKCIADDDNIAARSTLELIGKNKMVDAFSTKSRVEHSMKELPMAVSFNISFDAPPTSVGTDAQDSVPVSVDPEKPSIEGEVISD